MLCIAFNSKGKGGKVSSDHTNSAFWVTLIPGSDDCYFRVLLLLQMDLWGSNSKRTTNYLLRTYEPHLQNVSTSIQREN